MSGLFLNHNLPVRRALNTVSYEWVRGQVLFCQPEAPEDLRDLAPLLFDSNLYGMVRKLTAVLASYRNFSYFDTSMQAACITSHRSFDGLPDEVYESNLYGMLLRRMHEMYKMNGIGSSTEWVTICTHVLFLVLLIQEAKEMAHD